MDSRALSLVLALALLFGLVVGVSSVVADDEYDLAVTEPSPVEIPDRTTTFDSTDYTITAISRAQSGTSVTVETTVNNSGERHVVSLYNGDRNIVTSNQGTGNSTMEFDTDGLEAGSYMFALDVDGEITKIHPLVIPAFTVSIDDAPSSTVKGDNATVEAAVSRIEDEKSIDSVEVVIADDGTETRLEMDSVGSETYRKNVSTDEFSTGDYRVYVAVRGTETVEGSKELIGVSDAQDFTVESASTETTTTEDTSDEDGDGGGGGGGGNAAPPSGSTETETPSADTTTAQTTSPEETTIPTTTRNPSTDATDPGTSIDSEPNGESPDSPTQTTDNVLQPNTTETDTESGTTSSSTGFGALGAFPVFWAVVLLAVALSARRIG